MNEKRLDWRGDNNTQSAYNDKNEQVGWLSYEPVGRHYHWCWYQCEDFRMTPGCVEEMRIKQKELFKVRMRKVEE